MVEEKISNENVLIEVTLAFVLGKSYFVSMVAATARQDRAILRGPLATRSPISFWLIF